jgi:Holliday junction resolvase RusA-like endonuclease
MPRPKAHFDKAGDVRERYTLAPHIQKPDLDNLVKAVQDALTDVGVWRDDAQVNRQIVVREWCPQHARPGCDIVLNW